MAVTLIGVVLAPAAGMVGASVTTLTLIALPTMLRQGYRPAFAGGAIAAAGTLGVGLPPGIMLFFLADAMGMQVPFTPVLDALDFSTFIERPYVAFGWITILVALTLQSSFLTPPFGFALFLVRGSAPPGVRMAHLYRGIVPFVLIQVFVIACVAIFPSIATWLPDQLLNLEATRGVKVRE